MLQFNKEGFEFKEYSEIEENPFLSEESKESIKSYKLIQEDVLTIR